MPTALRAVCVIVGDSSVGKSALTQMFHSDGSHFPKNYSLTVGVELVTKTVTVPDSHDNVELFLYDSAGKEVFADMLPKYWEQPNMVMVVYDVTNEMSFSSCAKWLERVRSRCRNIRLPGVLVANKTDLDERRVISPKAGKEFAETNGLEYFECSAKEGQNIDQAFLSLCSSYYRMYQEKVEVFKTLA